MGNRPRKGYDYRRAGVAMVTLKTRPGMWLCRITQEAFELTETGRIVQRALGEITGFYEQVKIGQYQIMPFISPHERRVLRKVIDADGRAIRLTHVFLGERYKPMGELFDLCCAGRLLEISIAGEFARYAKLDRAACLRLNEVAEVIATTEWSQWRV